MPTLRSSPCAGEPPAARLPGQSSRLLRRMTGALTAAGLMIAVMGLATRPAWAVKTSWWTEEGPKTFAEGTREGLVLSSRGLLRLSGRAANLAADMPDVVFVNALVADPRGGAWALTGPKGVVLHFDAAGRLDGRLQLPDHPMLLSGTAGRNGDLYIGTGGKTADIVRVPTEGRPVVLTTVAGSRYVWALAWDGDDHLYAACGADAKVVRITPDGAAEEVLRPGKEKNLTSLAVDGKRGLLYAGSDVNGLVYRLSLKGGQPPFVLYDAAESEITALAVDDKGRVIACTGDPRAAGRGGGGGSLEPGQPPAGGPGGRVPGAGANAAGVIEPSPAGTAAAPLPAPAPPAVPAPPPPPPPAVAPVPDGTFGSAERGPGSGPAPTPRAGGNAVYRLGADGEVETLLRAAGTTFLAVELSAEGILLGTGNEGRLLHLDPETGEHRILLRSRSNQITALLRTGDGRVWLGAGNNGAVGRLEFGHLPAGTLVSKVFDAKLPSRWGRISWDAEVPPGSKIEVRTRSGNVDEPADGTWSPWSPVAADAEGSRIASPPARFLQYEVRLSTADGRVSPVLERVKVSYVTDNQAPRVRDVRAEPVGAGGGGASTDVKGTPPEPLNRLLVRWASEDPNEDTLTHTVWFREKGDAQWIALDRNLKGAPYRWDTTTVGDGRYELRVEASDGTDNPTGAKSGAAESTVVTVDNTRPEVTIDIVPAGRRSVKAVIRGVDKLSPLTAAAWSLDSNTEFTVLLPDDGVFDSRDETFTLELKDLPPGEHRLAVRVLDARNNLGHGKAVVRVGR